MLLFKIKRKKDNKYYKFRNKFSNGDGSYLTKIQFTDIINNLYQPFSLKEEYIFEIYIVSDKKDEIYIHSDDINMNITSYIEKIVSRKEKIEELNNKNENKL